MKPDRELTTMNISLPRSQREFVEEAAARSGCTTTSEFIRRLIHEAQRQSAQQDLERKLLEGLESGSPIDVTPEYFEEKIRQLRSRNASEAG